MSDTEENISEACTEFPHPPSAPMRPVWCTVIGVLSICLGAMMVCEYGVSITNLFALYGDSPYPTRWADVAGAAGGLLLNGLLIVAGVSLLKHRLPGVIIHLVYAGVGGAWVISNRVWFALVYFDSAEPLEHATQLLVLSLLQRWLPRLVYPVFLLVWFLRKRVRRQWRAATEDLPKTEPRDLSYHNTPGTAQWTTVVGVLSVVIAASYGWPALVRGARRIITVLIATREYPFLQRGLYLEDLVTVVHLVLVGLLIVAGVSILRRRPAGVKLHAAFGWSALGLISFQILLQYYRYASIDVLSEEDFRRFLLRSVLLRIAEAVPMLVYSILLIAWFSRSEVRAQAECWLAEG